MTDRPSNSLTGTASDAGSFAIPNWFTDTVAPDLSDRALRVMWGMCRHRQPDGRTIWPMDRIMAECKLSRRGADQAVKELCGDPRALLIEHVRHVYTPFPAEQWPGDPAARWAPAAKVPVSSNERTIQLALANDIRSSIVVAAPNYTPVGWWEADLWAVTRAGYAVEYEIKVSVVDFHADRAKSCREFDSESQSFDLHKKHDRLAAGDPAGPSRFFYVIPEEIRPHIEPRLPKWAGLVIYQKHRVRFVVQAPKLHAVKVKAREIRLAQRRMWFRYWQAIAQIERARLRGGVP